MRYCVTIIKDGRCVDSYTAIGNSFDLHAAAIDKYGVCSVFVMRAK